MKSSFLKDCVFDTKSINCCEVRCRCYRCGNTLRFPRDREETPPGKATRLFGGTSSAQSQSQLKLPPEMIFASEEAEALPAESDCPEWISTCSYFAVHTNYGDYKQQKLRKEENEKRT